MISSMAFLNEQGSQKSGVEQDRGVEEELSAPFPLCLTRITQLFTCAFSAEAFI